MNNNGAGSFFGSDWLGAFLIIAVLFGGFGGFGAGRGPLPMPDVATKEFVQDSINQQALQQGQKEILLSSANNNLETYKAINEQTGALQLQMFNHQLNEESRFGELRSKLDQLGFQMESCCCSIKTQMLQDKYDQLLEKYNTENAERVASNAANFAINTLLSTMGKWVANAPAAAA
jgi:hypothetical protein